MVSPKSPQRPSAMIVTPMPMMRNIDVVMVMTVAIEAIDSLERAASSVRLIR